jgi:hypothetical protein
MNVNLARQSDFATVGEAQERPVREGPELTVIVPTLNERDNMLRSSSCWMRRSRR